MGLRDKLADISASLPGAAAPVPPPKRRPNGATPNADKSPYTHGYGPPKTAFLQLAGLAARAPSLVAGARGLVGLGAQAGAPAVAQGVNTAVQGGVAAKGLLGALRRKEAAILHPTIDALALAVLAETPAGRKVANATLSTPGAVDAGRALFEPLVASGLVRVD